MPCDSGPDTRRIWEIVRDFQLHHDETDERCKQLQAQVQELEAKNARLQRKIVELVELK